MLAAAEVVDRLYACWNAHGLATVGDVVDPGVQLVCDPLAPVETALSGRAGWDAWVARWERGYEAMQITVDGLVPLGGEHVLALISIHATPRGGRAPIEWAAAHVWTVRDGRIARWESHVDLEVARATLLS